MREPWRVAVILGGQSAEREVSLCTGQNVANALKARNLVKPVEILANGSWRVPAGFLGREIPADPACWHEGEGEPILEGLTRLLDDRIDVVFNALHGPVGEDGTIQGLLRMVGLPFTGPDVIPAAVTMDKRLTKQVLVAAGVPTPAFFTLRAATLREGDVDWKSHLEKESGGVPLPWVLKPNRLGSSVGVAILRTPKDVLERAQDVIDRWPETAWGDDLLVEAGVTGRELTCGVLETDGRPRALPPIEIRPRKSDFFDYTAKYTAGASEEICPAPITPHEREMVQSTAVRVHRLFECAPLSRTDMFLTPAGTLQVLEVNTLPGMTATSLVPLAASKDGLSLEDLFSSIIEHALARTAPVSALALRK